MRVTLNKDGIYGKKGDVIELGTKKAIELGLTGKKEEKIEIVPVKKTK